jgi:putative ABC transport system permease protein
VRFALLSAAVGLLVFLILFQQALFGSLLLSFTGALENQSGTVLVYGAEARKNLAGSVILPPQQQAVAAVEGVGASAPVGEATLTVEAGGDEVNASIFGFTPGGPGEPTRVVDGRMPTGPTEALASKEDRDAGFAIGDTVTSVDGDVAMQVVGLTERSRYSVSPTLWVTFDGYVALREAANPDATAVLPSVMAVVPAAGVSPSVLAERITSQVDGVEALTRDAAVAESPGVSATTTSFNLILALALLVVALVIGFFFVILTVQKTPSLVLLRAIGAPSWYLVRSVLVQIALVVVAGVVVGLALTFAAVSAISAGLPISVDGTTFAVLVAAVVGLALVGAAFALVRVARLDPASVVDPEGRGAAS